MPENENVMVGRHSLAHVLAKAVMELFDGVKIAIGPAIDSGFYYDFEIPHVITEEDFPKIEDKMKEIIKRKENFVRKSISAEDALELFKDQPYKVELINDLKKTGEDMTVYYLGEDFVDLCRGPHVENAEVLNSWSFKISNVAGAYWRGDENNTMLQRIYVFAYPSKAELKEHLNFLEEAKKRDHRKLGKELGLFALRDEAPGMPFFLPNGMILRNTLIDYWHEVHERWGYLEISTPQIMKRSLWETSGHWDHYKDNMYTTVIDGEDFAIKPMNCPGSILVYELEPHSYKELPLRYGELGRVHRHELSGALHGLFRVRCFTQDDAHILLAPDQIRDEVVRISQLFDEVYNLFKLPYTIELSTMPEDHMGTKEEWDKATKSLSDAIESIGKEYTVNEGDGAFYGPKLDFHIEDSLGRTWQCGTIQLDFQLPERFNLEYTGADGEKHCPVMIHRVVFGSVERFIGVLIEHFAGAFPLWLSPVQAVVLPIADRHADRAHEIEAELKKYGIRVKVDDRSEKIGYKIREAQLQKTPYMLVVGDKEVENGTVSVRHRGEGDIGSMELSSLCDRLADEVKTKAIK